MNDKEIFYSVLGREIDNLLSFNPATAMLSGVVKNWVFKYIDPYVSLFIEGERLNTKMATSFVKEEISAKIDNFKKRFEEEINAEQEI